MSLQVSVATSRQHPHSYHQQEPSGLQQTSYLILHSSASGPTVLATSSPVTKRLPNKQPAPDELVSIGPTAILLQPYPAVTVLMPLHWHSQPHTVTGRDTHCRQPGSPRLPHSCPIRFSLPAAIRNYSTLALIPMQAKWQQDLICQFTYRRASAEASVTHLPALLGPQLCAAAWSSGTSCSQATPWSA